MGMQYKPLGKTGAWMLALPVPIVKAGDGATPEQKKFAEAINERARAAVNQVVSLAVDANGHPIEFSDPSQASACWGGCGDSSIDPVTKGIRPGEAI